MKIPIGKKICKLCKDKNITQEEFANAIGVSVADILKWENENLYPDINLLVSVARYLETSVNELFNFTKELSNEEILKINREFKNIFEEEGLEKAIEYLEKNIKEYPNNNYFKHRGNGMLQMHTGREKTEDGINKIVLRAIEFSKAVNESKNTELKNVSYALLSNLYMSINDFDDAEKALINIPKVDLKLDGVLPTIYFMKGEIGDVEKLYQMNLYLSINNSVTTLNGMVEVARKEKDYERAIHLLNVEKEVIKLFNLEDIMMLQYYWFTILTYSDMKEVNKTLDAMEQYVQYINSFESRNYDISKNEFFDKNKTGVYVMESMKDMKKALLEDIKQNPRYDFVRDTQRYKSIIDVSNN